MSELARPGVNSAWQKSWKSAERRQDELIELNRPRFVSSLEEYIFQGFTNAQMATYKEYPREPVSPPHKFWESTYVSDPMEDGLCYPAELEIKTLRDKVFACQIAAYGFAANYTGQMVDFYSHELFPLRFNGRNRKGMHLDSTAFSALGFIIGCEKEAIRLARMQLAGYRKDYFYDKSNYPIFNFVLRIFSDYLNEPHPVIEGDSLEDPIFNELIGRWREPNPEKLVHILLAACDFHTQRCKVGKNKIHFEFENGRWTRTPFEILLMFKMRQKIGLQNPVLDHPLMNTALGVLPPETPFEPDELVARVRSRMFTEGYDEDAIYEMVVAH